MTHILVAGISTLDVIMQVHDLPVRAEKYRADAATLALGGCAANAALAVTRQGTKAVLASRLGDDAIGGMIAALLAEAGVDTGPVQRTAGGRSAFSTISVDHSGERQIVNFRGEGLATEPQELAQLSPPLAVLADTRWPALTTAALEQAKCWAVPGIVDGEPPFDGVPLGSATHIAFSRAGLDCYAPGQPTDDALRAAAREFDAWVAVTDGAQGVWFIEGDAIAHIPAMTVEVVDTLGAGDVWHGVFACELGRGASPADAIRFANAAAALKCTRFGGATGTPTRAETEDFIRKYT